MAASPPRSVPRNREQLTHGQNFSETIHGAALLYNLMLAETANRSDSADEYKDRLKEWATTLETREAQFAAWDRNRFWDILLKQARARIACPTRLFIEQWLSLALKPGSARSIHSNTKARDLIHARERTLKHALARLDNRRALELWNGAAGTGQLDFRWAQAGTIIEDILTGLKGGRHA